MRQIVPVALLLWLTAGCTTYTNYKAQAPAAAPTTADYPIPVYTLGMEVPRPCKVIGEISIEHTYFTVVGGSVNAEMTKVMKTAHAKGADAVQIVSLERPGFDSPDYFIKAKLLRYADRWEQRSMSEKDLVAYLEQSRKSLDPIEGIWSDDSGDQIGIIRDATRPGRDFVAFTLIPDSLAWRPGYKKMDIVRSDAPGVYALRYYHKDFSASDFDVSLDQDRSFELMINSEKTSYQETFNKNYPPPPTR